MEHRLAHVLEAEVDEAKNSRSIGPTLVAASMITLAIVFVAYFPLSERSIAVQVEQYILLTYTSLRAGMCIRSPQPKIATLIAWLWSYTLFGLVQVVQISKAINPFHILAPDANMSRQLFIVLIGLAAMDFAATRIAAGRVRPATQRRQISLRRTTAFSIITVASAPFVVTWLGGVSSVFGSRLAISLAIGSFNQDSPTGAIIVLEAANVAPLICAFCLWRLRQGGMFTFKARPDLAIIFFLLLVTNIFLNNPISVPRFWIATIAISLAIAGQRLRSIKFQVAFVGGYILASIVLFPYLDLTRYTDVSQATVSSSSLEDSYLNKTDYGSAQDVTNAVTHVDLHGHTDGKQLLGAVLFFIPRTIWPEKPMDTAKLLAADIGSQNTNLDSPLWAEGYIDFGLPGVIIILGLFGLVIGRADRAYLGGSNPLAIVSVLVPVLVGYELLILRGSLLQSMGRLSLVLAISWIVSHRSSNSTA